MLVLRQSDTPIFVSTWKEPAKPMCICVRYFSYDSSMDSRYIVVPSCHFEGKVGVEELNQDLLSVWRHQRLIIVTPRTV